MRKGEGMMGGIRAYEGWWDLSLIDEMSERALLSAFVATVVVSGDGILARAHLKAESPAA
jgi:hypothetical protein